MNSTPLLGKFAGFVSCVFGASTGTSEAQTRRVTRSVVVFVTWRKVAVKFRFKEENNVSDVANVLILRMLKTLRKFRQF